MSDPELPWKLLVEKGSVFLRFAGLKQYTLLDLGPKEQVMEAFSQFLAHEDYGERMDG